MDWIDYREKLGIGFNDEEKIDLLIKRIEVFLQSSDDIPFEESEEKELAYTIGDTYLPANKPIIDLSFRNESKGLQRAWLYLSNHTDDFVDFLSCLVALSNIYYKKFGNKRIVLDRVLQAFKDSHVEIEIIEDVDGVFLFPKGAKEFDDALVSQPLEWLKDYPGARNTYVIALKQYSDGIYIRDVADNLRKALETFLQEFLGNTKNLETNKNEICKYLGEQGVDSGVSGLFQTLINSYKNINDRIAKHNDAVDKKLLEFLLYQTGILIRMVITIKMSEVYEDNND